MALCLSSTGADFKSGLLKTRLSSVRRCAARELLRIRLTLLVGCALPPSTTRELSLVSLGVKTQTHWPGQTIRSLHVRPSFLFATITITTRLAKRIARVRRGTNWTVG